MWLPDYLNIIVYWVPFAIIFFVTLFTEYLIKGKTLNPFIGRKLLHIVSLFCCAISVFLAPDKQWHLLIFLGASVLLFIFIRFKIFFSETNSYGIAFFALAFGVLLFFPFLNRNQVLFTMLTLGFADAFAGLTGHFFAKNKIPFLNETKSWLGFTTFYITTIIIYCIIFGWNTKSLPLVFLVALVPALSELFSIKGSDNLTTPLVTGIWVYLLQNKEMQFSEAYCIVLILLGLAFFGTAKKILDTSGAAAAFFVGLISCLSIHWYYIIVLAFFLIIGSLVSRLNKTTLEKKGRNAIQVFSNGLVAIICLLSFAITGKIIFEIAYFASIAISLCDTVSSETGKYFKGKTIDILSFKKTTVGLSGGISIQGSLCSLFAAVVYVFLVYGIFRFSFAQCCIIGLIGFWGMLIDSVLGSSLQALYKKENVFTETPDGILVKGKSWCTNDMVNFLSNLIVTVLFAFIGYFVV